MNKLQAVVVDGYSQALLGLAHSANQPELAVGVLNVLSPLYAVKKDRLSPKHTFVKTYTKSTRQLVERAKVLFDQPEHAASNCYPDQAPRRVYDWCLGNFTDTDLTVLKRVLTQSHSGRHITNRERRLRWQDARQELVCDILSLCDIVINHKAVY